VRLSLDSVRNGVGGRQGEANIHLVDCSTLTCNRSRQRVLRRGGRCDVHRGHAAAGGLRATRRRIISCNTEYKHHPQDQQTTLRTLYFLPSQHASCREFLTEPLGRIVPSTYRTTKQATEATEVPEKYAMSGSSQTQLGLEHHAFHPFPLLFLTHVCVLYSPPPEAQEAELDPEELAPRNGRPQRQRIHHTRPVNT
jgi:hypothetical protein